MYKEKGKRIRRTRCLADPTSLRAYLPLVVAVAVCRCRPVAVACRFIDLLKNRSERWIGWIGWMDGTVAVATYRAYLAYLPDPA